MLDEAVAAFLAVLDRHTFAHPARAVDLRSLFLPPQTPAALAGGRR